MLVAVGKKVKFLHTGDEGVITKLLPGCMVQVFLPKSGMEIPAFEEDLIESIDSTNKTPKKQSDQAKKTSTPMVHTPQTQYTILKGEGVQLAFESANTENVAGSYRTFLINDTSYDAVCDIRMTLKNGGKRKWDGKINSFEFKRIFDIIHDELNEAPEFGITCQWITTEGKEEKDCKVLKIRAKTFFNSIKMAPLLNRRVHLYPLFEQPPRDAGQAPVEKLDSYTRRHSMPSWKMNKSGQEYTLHDVKELAEFQGEIDLHIEALTKEWRKMNSGEIVKLQMQHFESFMEKSIRLGAPRVFIIHGMGEGKLRNQIATRLLQIPEVVNFKNEYHPKYGWGATEVLLE